jgi:ubiquinone/menaquinone biosynthesis C-methylase UbiE
MRRRGGGRLLGSATVAACAALAWWLQAQRPAERIPDVDALDDADVVRAYDAVAQEPAWRALRWWLVRRALALARVGSALDLGCGPGYLAVALARRAPSLHVIGVDLATEMLARARDAARQAQLTDHLSFGKGDARHIPFPAGSLDLVVSTLSLHHWDDPLAVLDEIARVLRPGGSFLIVDLRRDMCFLFWTFFWFVTHRIAPPALRRAQEPLRSIRAAYTPEEVAHLAEHSRLQGWRVACGPTLVRLEGTTLG